MSNPIEQPVQNNQPVKKTRNDYTLLSILPTAFVIILGVANLNNILFHPRYMNDAALSTLVILPLIFFAIIPALSMLKQRGEQEPAVRRLLIAAICVNLLALTLPAISGVVYALGLSN